MSQPSPTYRDEDDISFRQTWDTSSVSEQDRFSYFRESVCQAFLSFSPEKPADGDIDARVETARLPRGYISKIDVSPHDVLRTKSDLAKIPTEFLSLGLQLTGGLQGQLSRKKYSQKRGDVTLVEANEIERIQLDAHERYSVMTILFPKSLVKTSRFVDIEKFEGPSQRALKSCLGTLNDRYQNASHAELVSLFNVLISLVEAELIRDRDFLEDRCAKDAAISSGLLQAIKDFVARHLGDPALSTPSVAAHFGISARYVQKLFASGGITFKAFVIQARLDQIRGDLLDYSTAHIPTSDIAFRWGFRDMTTFHRTFKHRFGDTPGQMRSAARNRLLSL